MFLLALLILPAVAAQVAPPPEGAPMTPALRRLLEDGGMAERVATNFGFADGAVWVDGTLVFSDRPRNQVLRWKTGEEPVVVFEGSGGTSGLALDEAGRLLMAERTARRVSRREDGEVQVLADAVAGTPLGAPTDLAVAADGSVYVVDGAVPGARGVTSGRVVRIGADGATSVVADLLMRPTGVAVSPDGRRLYVSDAGRREVRAYDLDVRGPSRTLATIVPWKRGVQGSADGLTVDGSGRVFLAGPGGIWVLDANGGRLGVIATPETPSSCVFGDADGRTLYITAETSVYKVRMSAAAR